MPRVDEELELIDFVGQYAEDFRGWLKVAYEWNKDQLIGFDGPEDWVNGVADDISNQVALNHFDGVHPVMTVYVAIGSGNGCAKSAFAGMIDNWLMSTRECRVTVMANTGDQLKQKTWPEILKWNKLSITSHWWRYAAETVRHREKGADWATNQVTWNLKNISAVAGQHKRTGSSVYIFDECARIPEPVYEESEGGLTDGEPFWIMLGNPTVRSGRLYRAVFGNLRWNGPDGDTPPPGEFVSRSIDSRTCRYTNKARIDKWAKERGEESDWFRSHVRGLAPNAGDLQFIDAKRVQDARTRAVPASDGAEPLIMSIDFARGGSAFNIIGYRRGRDARSIPRKRVPGELTRDTTKMVSLVALEINDRHPDAVFGDSTGLGGPIMDRLRQLFPAMPIYDVINGGDPPDHFPHKASEWGNWRAYCWGHMREWLTGGCIEDDEKLETDLTNPEFYHSAKDRVFLESKDDMEQGEDGIPSPDDGDQLAMTFAMPIKTKTDQRTPPSRAMLQRSRPNRQSSGSKRWTRR